MGRISTMPTLYDEALQMNITKLVKWGFLEQGEIKNGTLNWSRNGNPTGSISVIVNTRNEQPYIELDYKFRDEPRKYKVFLTSIPSNLNKGLIWYFLCPVTHKRCRKLYSIGGYFLHREAFKGCFYESQIQSKHYRFLDKNYGMYFKFDEIYTALHKKHFKKNYAGKPTKRYLKLKKLMEEAESINHKDIERLLVYGK